MQKNDPGFKKITITGKVHIPLNSLANVAGIRQNNSVFVQKKGEKAHCKTISCKKSRIIPILTKR